MRGLAECWEMEEEEEEEDGEGVAVTYAQAYIPVFKSFGNCRPFHLHPFLLSFLLGREYIASKRSLRAVHDATEREVDYATLREALLLNVTGNRARFEVAVTSRRLDSLLAFNSTRYARTVRNASLLVEVSSRCCTRVV